MTKPSVNPTIFVFDLSSNFSRNYFRVKNKGEIPSDGYINGIPVFAVKSTIYQVLKECRRIAEVHGNPSHLILTIDNDEDTFRKEIYPEYKGQRPPKEEDFYIQRKMVIRLFEMLGLRVISKKGFEADDIIATVAHKASKAAIPTIISTRDKDMFALIDDVVTVFSGIDDSFIDYQSVIDLKGVPPERITDMLVLEGDKVDNIIGIEGVGPAASKEILKQFSLKEILDNPQVLLNTKVRGKAKIVQYIEQEREFIELMREVATMRTDVDLGSNLNEWRVFNFPPSKTDAYRVIENNFSHCIREIMSASNAVN
ncbi:5'-3' exonuclease H3TH domain-containing protein [Vibrio sp. D431a]|uniref:5'-3' exonuclease n=1 Tax=Vibrio sp. D431a TaxID=2837388 RepID=UPI002552607C|nr:5'-3' exonuclease H3TH domain-containing protein [Vibrio sp. D431a]MDK9790173.1 hypothetical protein [Vibrio sp. D431a]